ncbi:MAG: hypothetical protein IJX13_08210, partial [Clostridia bacterium]|nr:hypothetical protein [Clostridia bacterium]
SKFSSDLYVEFLTEDEYYTRVSKALTAISKKEPDLGKAETKEQGELTFSEKYPGVTENQVDILYIGDLTDAEGKLTVSGEDMYREMISKGWLAALDSEITGSGASKKIWEDISPVLLNAVKLNGKTYAIPNNNPIGEYTYMLLNKTLADRYAMNGYVANGSIDGFYNKYVYQYLDMVISNEQTVLPVDAAYEECLALLAHYWSIDAEGASLEDTFSVFGSLLGDAESISRGETVFGVESLFENEDFVSAFLQLNSYRFAGQLNDTDAEDAEYTAKAIRFQKGSLADVTVTDGVAYYEDEGELYYAIPVKYPTATSEDVYGNMFGVSAYSKHISRATEVIAYLTSNAEFRNVLQYGVEDVHYSYNKDTKTVTHLSNKNGEQYLMDLYATGNVFIAYPDQWETAKEQNRKALIDPMFNFRYAEYAATLASAEAKILADAELTAYMAGLNAQILSLINACESYDALAALVEELRVALNTELAISAEAFTPDSALLASLNDTENGVVKGDFATLLYSLQRITSYTAMPKTPAEDGETDEATFYSPFGVYYEWMKANGYLPK